jgi:hypothetical protein
MEKNNMNQVISIKRITTATFFGLVMGVFCAAGAFNAGFLQFTAVNLVWVLLNRSVMGFMIGISGLKIKWFWNGILVGLVTGLIFSYSLFMNMGQVLVPFLNALVNGLFGLIIEFFTTKVFKLPSPMALHKTEANQ